MWLITTQGFLSVVQNLNSTGPNDALLVRARVREDLDHFADFVAQRGDRPTVTATPRFDYGYRLKTSREMFASYLTEQVGALNYPNFKNKVVATNEPRAHVYMGVWTALHKLRGIHAKAEKP